ncbi:Fasciclin-domain-containing protein [Basidiobolus meristosporus CBS 931.73]|uniref:Fasciclin-domain-containing protein n=1 Tax=Basidiobolus meristosporus CBS 931.73 TaxID=1314790 RepID=A0A1Y1XY08_9FUNG|nr:Fasciclin-domain-containing protein [Basidiobolus meristosporus CBS 931.73]|eukprot:ORX90633.1 Fasciclin-domain-containing protein [Basidiobolus meristosporus CBS 931.73]
MYFPKLLSLVLSVSTLGVLSQNLLEAIQGDASLKTLSSLLNDPNYVKLKEKLTGTEKFTIFAPTEAAFSNSKLDLNQPKVVLAHLQYHTVYGDFNSQTLTTKYFPFTLLNDAAYVNQNGDVQVLVLGKNNSQSYISQGLDSTNVTKLDAHKATNGVVHLVDAFLPPPKAPAEVIRESGFEKMADAVERAALVNTMNDLNRLTIFAPTNEVLIREDFESKTRPQLSPIVKNHVITDDIVLSQKLQDGAKYSSALGYSLVIKVTNGTTYVNDCPIIRTDILTNNGVLHIIDGVIAVPQSFYSVAPRQNPIALWAPIVLLMLAVNANL